MARRINFSSVNYRPPPIRSRGEARGNGNPVHPEQRDEAPAQPQANNRRPYYHYYAHQANWWNEPTLWEKLKNRYRDIDDSLNNFFDNIESTVEEADDKINEALNNLFDSLEFWKRR